MDKVKGESPKPIKLCHEKKKKLKGKDEKLMF